MWVLGAAGCFKACGVAMPGNRCGKRSAAMEYSRKQAVVLTLKEAGLEAFTAFRLVAND